MRILLSSASDAERAYLSKALAESLNSVETTDNLQFARYLAAQESFDAILICALGESSTEGLEAELKALREEAPGIVLVVVLARAVPADCVRLLRAGADACFVQPYSVLEIIERMRILGRDTRLRMSDGREVRLDPFTRELVDGERRIALTMREYLLIECLLREAGLPVAREYLISYVWPEKDSVELSGVNLMILRLRRKLERSGVHDMVQTVNRYGYRLMLD